MTQTAGIGVVDRRAVVPRTFAWSGEPQGERMRWFAAGLREVMLDQGYTEVDTPGPDVAVVLHFVDPEAATPVPAQERAHVRGRARRARRAARRHAPHRLPAARARPGQPVRDGEPVGRRLDRALRHARAGHVRRSTPAPTTTSSSSRRVFSRVEPLASSRLVIGNEFTDRPARRAAATATTITRQITRAGRAARRARPAAGRVPDRGDPLRPRPAPREAALRHRRAQLRQRERAPLDVEPGESQPQYWMSASGVDKSALHEVGRDILLVTGYDDRARRHAAARAAAASSRGACRSTPSSTG